MNRVMYRFSSNTRVGCMPNALFLKIRKCNAYFIVLLCIHAVDLTRSDREDAHKRSPMPSTSTATPIRQWSAKRRTGTCIGLLYLTLIAF